METNGPSPRLLAGWPAASTMLPSLCDVVVPTPVAFPHRRRGSRADSTAASRRSQPQVARSRPGTGLARRRCAAHRLSVSAVSGPEGGEGRRQAAASEEVVLTVDNASDANSTVVVLKGADREGLLSSVVSAFSTLDVHVQSATISTDAATGCVADTFLVQRHSGGKLLDADIPMVRPPACSHHRRGQRATIKQHPDCVLWLPLSLGVGTRPWQPRDVVRR